MKFDTHYALSLFFPNPAFVQIYFEAVANAIDAGADEISIFIRASGRAHAPKVEVVVSDNGAGFTDDRFRRFRDVKQPKDTQHKGMGRLVFLHYFERIDVASTYNGSRRTFTFEHNFDGKSKVSEAPENEPSRTTLTFRQFSGERIKAYDDLKPGAIRKLLLEQFLPILYERKRASLPLRIQIELETTQDTAQKDFFPDTQVLDLSALPEFKSSVVEDPTLDWFSKVDVFYHIKSDQADPLFLVAAVVDGRTVPFKFLDSKSVPTGTSAIFLFESELFNGRADTGRQRVVLPDDVHQPTLLAALRTEVARILDLELPEIKERNAYVQERFEAQFPHLTGLFETNTVGLVNRDEALEAAQHRFFNEQRRVLESDPSDDIAFKKSLELSARSLMEYVLYRDWVIKRLSSTTAEDREDKIHNLLVPRYERFDEGNLVDGLYRNNAWILDDKFMTFRTILSEATMNELINAITLEEASPDASRPDISMIFSADPHANERVDVVVIEIKRRTTDDKETTYASTQLLKRARKLVDHCPNIQRVWYYGIIEIDDELAQYLRDSKWTPLYSKGQVYYQEFPVTRKRDAVVVPTPIFLLSFDAITLDASARNHAFLELLKSKFKRQEI